MEIQISQIMFQAINFFVVLGALAFLLIKPITKILDQRAKKVADAQKAAEETLTEKEGLEAYKAKTKKQVDVKAAEILAEAKSRAKTKEQELMAESKAKIKAEGEKMADSWKLEKKKEQAKIKTQFEKAVLEAAKKVVGKSLDVKKHSTVIDKQLELLLKEI